MQGRCFRVDRVALGFRFRVLGFRVLGSQTP